MQENSQQPQDVKLKKVAEHKLTDAEFALLVEIYASFDRLRKLIADYMIEKHKYAEKEPTAFQFDWKNKKAIVYKPDQASSIEIAKDDPAASAKD